MKTLQCSDCSPGAHFPPQCPTNDMFVCNTICFLFLFLLSIPPSPPPPPLLLLPLLEATLPKRPAVQRQKKCRSPDTQDATGGGGRGQVQPIKISLPAKVPTTNAQMSISVAHRNGCFEICPPEGRVCSKDYYAIKKNSTGNFSGNPQWYRQLRLHRQDKPLVAFP